MGDQLEASVRKTEREPELRQPIRSDTGLHPQRCTHVEPTGTVHELRAAHPRPRVRNQSTNRRWNRLGRTGNWQRERYKLETEGHGI